MKKQHLPFHSLHGFYKVVLLLPLFFVLLAIFFKIQEKVAVSNNVTKVVATPTAVPVSQTTLVSPEAKIKIDLTGPYVCNYSDKTASVSAFIKDKNIYVELSQQKKQNILVKGDCAYRWEPVKKIGDKMCGISTYLSTFEMLSSMGIADTSGLLSKLPLAGTEKGSDELIKNAINSCKKEEVKDTTFTIPANVVFKTAVVPTQPKK